MIDDDRVLKGLYLREWVNKDDFVREAVAAACTTERVGSSAELAEKNPDKFDELFDLCADIIEQDSDPSNWGQE